MIAVERAAKRGHGEGSVTRLANDPRTGAERWWARGPRQPDGSRPSLGIHAAEEIARTMLDHGRAELLVRKRDGAPTFLTWGDKVLDIRETDGIRGVDHERRRFRRHLATSLFANKPIDRIDPADILQWTRALGQKRAADKRGKRKISRKTIARCLALCSAIFTEALGVHVDRNPCIGIKIKASVEAEDDEDKEDVWDWLRREEQLKFWRCATIPEWFRCLVAFCWGTGLRQGEVWHLELKDLHVEGLDPYVFVRRGSRKYKPKSGKQRRVKLFGDALAVAKRWLEIRQAWLGDVKSTLVFPTVTGCRRQSGAPDRTERVRDTDGTLKKTKAGKDVYRKADLLREACELAGIERYMRWHDLRHTFCSSCVSGAWGDPWSLEEIKEAAGHSSITVTEQYAHLGETAQKRAAREKIHVGYELVTGNGGAASSVAAIRNELTEVDPLTSTGVTEGLKGRGVVEVLRALAGENASHNPAVTHLATALAGLLAKPMASS